MPMPDSTARRRPVPPPKTESQAQLRQELTSPGRSPRDASNQPEVQTTAQSQLSDAEARRRETMKHLTLPPGWNMANEVDVTYHTHIAKPIVHETIHQHTTELVEPRITREIHHYHQYDHIQPLEVEIPNDSYVTNAKGEVVHAPGGLGTHTGQSSYWEQERQDKGYSLAHTQIEEDAHERNEAEVGGRDKTAGPFPIQAEGGGERVLEGIRDGGIARRFGGSLTSANTTSHPVPTTTGEGSDNRTRGSGLGGTSQYQPSDVQSRPRGGFEETTPFQQSYSPNAPHTPPRSGGFPSASEGMPASGHPNLEQNFDRPPSRQQHPEAKPLPSIPNDSPPSPHSNSTVRRMSSDNKLRDRFRMEPNRPSLESQNTMIDDEADHPSDRTKKTRRY